MEFLTPPPLCPQNLYYLCANLWYFLTPAFPGPFHSDVIYGSPLQQIIVLFCERVPLYFPFQASRTLSVQCICEESRIVVDVLFYSD